MLRPDELVIDNFAGGGGASLGIEQAIGRPIDVAINHDAEAVALHQANHPATHHLCQSVWKADPRDVVVEASRRRGNARPLPVGLAWFSPDCKHFSKAKGGKPVEKHIRDLAWVVVHWARLVRPRIILLENVEEFRDWGPLVETEGGKLLPCPLRRGLTFRAWKRELVRLGYRVEERELRAADYGAPTIRKRLFVVARRDGAACAWPEPSHAKAGAGGLAPWRAAAECIDWSTPCPSIFGRDRPLVEATMARIGRGVWRYVIGAAEPFIVPVTHQGDQRCWPASEPLRTITTARRGEHALAAVYLAQHNGDRTGRPAEDPLSTIVHRGTQQQVVAAFLAQHNTGLVGHPATAPVSTIVGKGCTQALVAATLSHNYTSNTAGGQGDPRLPMKTVVTGGHHALVQAFLVKYYGSAVGQSAGEPLHTATAKPRFGLVQVAGQDYRIVDIGMRMLTPRELYRAQGFPDSYRIDAPGPDGRPLTKTAQIRMCGNSVCPPVARALVTANIAAGAAEREAS
jgi:DNA (cytosine-5)-methyltransferase 1